MNQISISLPTDSTCQLHVRGKQRDTFCVQSAEIRFLKQLGQVLLRRFLQGQDCGCLKSQILLGMLLTDLTHKASERNLANEKLSGPLIATDFAKGNSARAESVHFFHLGQAIHDSLFLERWFDSFGSLFAGF